MPANLIMEFDMNAVEAAQNPSEFGYHHGPIPPGLSIRISNVNTTVCDVDMGSERGMCGQTFKLKASLYAHIRKFHRHSHDVEPVTPGKRAESVVAGQNAIRRWVLYGGWRRAKYYREPRKLAADSLIYRFVNEFESRAMRDAEFASTFGHSFGRPSTTLRPVRGPVPTAINYASEQADSSEAQSNSRTIV